MRFAFGACTDVGMVRQSNEDAYSAEEGLFVVADGMGGHNAGEVASALAVATIRSGVRSGLRDPSHFGDVVQAANAAIYTASLDDSAQSGMGTTVTAVAPVPGGEPRIMVANVGDSRTYVFFDGTLSPVSVDHSYVQELVNEGIITREEARHHPRRNVVTRALGIDRAVTVDVFVCGVVPGDRILLCSDGLVDEVSEEQIAAVLGEHRDPRECAEALVMVANTNGGHDNTTVIVVDVLEDSDEPAGVSPDDPKPSAGFASSSARTVVAASQGGTPVEAGSPAVEPAVATRPALRRALAWGAAVVAIAVVASVGTYARGGCFVGFTENDRVAVWKGRPGGVLWFDPTVDTETSLSGDDLPPDVLRDVLTKRGFASTALALAYVDSVTEAIAAATTTTAPATTTTTLGD